MKLMPGTSVRRIVYCLSIVALLTVPLASGQEPPQPAAAAAASSPAAPGWTNEVLHNNPRGGFRNWYRLIYDPVQRKVLAWMAVSACDDPWSNALWAYDPVAHNFERKTWAGSGAVVDGKCARPVFLARAHNHPGDRHPYHQMTYDTKRGRLWIYGGVSDSGKCDGSGPGYCTYVDTWYYDSRTNSWTCTDKGGGCNNDTSKMTNPGRRLEGAMEYDPDHDVLVLFGSSVGGSPTSDTWEYSPRENTWTRVLPDGALGSPPSRQADSMVYDSVDHKIILFGGNGRKNQLLNDLWFYDAGRRKWTNAKAKNPPPGSRFPALAYDPARNIVLYYKGPTDLWAYSPAGNEWTKLPLTGGPEIKMAAGTSLTYDPDTDTYVLFQTQGRQVWQLKLGHVAGSTTGAGASRPPSGQER